MKVRTIAREPEEVAEIFVERANDGDVEGLVSLYEPEALLVWTDGRRIQGTRELRVFYTELLAPRPRFDPATASPALRCGDIALASSVLPNGDVTAEVLRRQPDGRWLCVVDQTAISKG